MMHKALIIEDSNKMHTALDISDMAPSDFEHLITYMYFGEVSFGNVHELCFSLYAAEQFELHDLRIQCLNRLQKRIRKNHSTAAGLIDAQFKFSIVCNNEQIFAEAVDIMKSHYEEVLTSDCIGNISKNTMEPDRNEEEIAAFRALLRWSETFLRRSALAAVGDLVTAVEYDRIPVELINCVVAPSGLLDDKLCRFAYESASGGSVVHSRFGKKPEKLASGLLDQVRQQLKNMQREVLQFNGCVLCRWTHRYTDRDVRRSGMSTFFVHDSGVCHGLFR